MPVAKDSSGSRGEKAWIDASAISELQTSEDIISYAFFSFCLIATMIWLVNMAEEDPEAQRKATKNSTYDKQGESLTSLYSCHLFGIHVYGDLGFF